MSEETIRIIEKTDSFKDQELLGGPVTPWSVLEALLKKPGNILQEIHRGRAAPVIACLIVTAVFSLLIYGLTVGMFSYGVQLWAAPVKIALGMGLSALICLPSLYIFSCLSGSSASLKETCGILAGAVCLIALLLLGFGPVSWVFAQSTASEVFMGILHLLLLAIALKFGIGFLRRSFAGLDARSTGHLLVWSVVFILVLLQMTTALRPLIGTSDRVLTSEKKFFLTHWVDCLDESGRHSTPPKTRATH